MKLMAVMVLHRDRDASVLEYCIYCCMSTEPSPERQSKKEGATGGYRGAFKCVWGGGGISRHSQVLLHQSCWNESTPYQMDFSHTREYIQKGKK